MRRASLGRSHRSRLLAAMLGLLCGALLLVYILPRGVARLETREGTVLREHAKVAGAWVMASQGTYFDLDDGLRTEARSTCQVQIVEGPRLHVRPSTLLRFRGRRDQVAQITLAQGEVSIFTAEEPVIFETAAGLLRIDAHSRALLRRDAGQVRAEVVFGLAQVQWASSAARTLSKGEALLFSEEAGTVTYEPAQHLAAPTDTTRANNAVPSPQVPTDAHGHDGDSSRQSVAPAHPQASAVRGPVDLTLPALPILHILDGAPPTWIRLRSPRCAANKAVLQVERDDLPSAPPSGTDVHAFPIGDSRYRLLCDQRMVAQGKVRVSHDSGRRQLASVAPVNRIEIDGRSYSVLYPSALPELSVRWSSAPIGSINTLWLEGPSGRHSYSVEGPEFAVPSRDLGEGSYRIWFERTADNRRSRTTQVELRFDNATPQARLNEDIELTLEADGTARLSGTVLDGASVSVAGRTVAVDRKGHFEANVQPTPGERAISVAVRVPRRGVLHYVRRFKQGEIAP